MSTTTCIDTLRNRTDGGTTRVSRLTLHTMQIQSTLIIRPCFHLVFSFAISCGRTCVIRSLRTLLIVGATCVIGTQQQAVQAFLKSQAKFPLTTVRNLRVRCSFFPSTAFGRRLSSSLQSLNTPYTEGCNA